MANQGRNEPSGWAIGFSAFAAFMLMLIGFFHVIAGLAAIIENEFYVVAPNWIFQFDVTTWGWIHLLLGIIIILAGFGIFSGAVWARTVGVIFATISAIANFAFLPYFPVWSAIMIAVDIAVIWALTARGRDIVAE